MDSFAFGRVIVRVVFDSVDASSTENVMFLERFFDTGNRTKSFDIIHELQYDNKKHVSQEYGNPWLLSMIARAAEP